MFYVQRERADDEQRAMTFCDPGDWCPPEEYPTGPLQPANEHFRMRQQLTITLTNYPTSSPLRLHMIVGLLSLRTYGAS